MPLDIFPTDVIGSTVIQKSYSVVYPGEFGGGVINLTTKSIPDEGFFKISTSIGANTETTFQTGYSYYGAKSDWTGFDNGTRDLPPLLEYAFDNNFAVTAGENFTDAQLKDLTASLVNAPTTLVQRNNNIPANFSVQASGGTNFYVGDVYMGVIATAGWDNGWRTRGGKQEVSALPDGEGQIFPLSSYDYLTTQNRIVVNGMVGLSAEFGEHKLRWTNLYIRDTAKEAKIREGYQTSVDRDTPLNQSRTSWFERQLITTQLNGDFDFGNLKVAVRGSYANAQRESPYEREFSYVWAENIAGSGHSDFINDLTSPGTAATIAFSNLEDNTWGGALNFSYDLDTTMPINLSAGYNYSRNSRASLRRDFSYETLDGSPLDIAVAQERPDYLTSDFNVYNYDVTLREFFGVAGAQFYSAELETHGLYGQVDMEIVPSVRLEAGVRWETADQSVDPVDLFNLGSVPIIPTQLNNDYWLPAGTVTWNMADDMQLRFSASRTIARPQFRELASQQFLDIETDRTLFGNEFLVDSDLFNLEARYEYYNAQDLRFTAAIFYKDIDNPIENVAFAQGDSARFTTFANAPSATLWGVEVEAVQFFDLYDWFEGDFFSTRRLMASVNYTFTDSEIKVSDGDTVLSPTSPGVPQPASNVFNDGDPLTGQSKHLVNAQFGLENDGDRLSQQTILLKYNSPRVTNRGVQGQPDVYENTGWIVDFVWREGIELANQEVELKFEVRNIFGADYLEDQKQSGTQVIANSYDYGTTFKLGASIKF